MTTRKHPRLSTSQRAGQSLRPPRYRLLSAAGRLPRRPPVEPTVAFESDCPACGRSVLFTQVVAAKGIEYRIEDHDCG